MASVATAAAVASTTAAPPVPASSSDQVIAFNKVGLSFHPATGSLLMDLLYFTLEFQDAKGQRTLLCSQRPVAERSPLVKATWSESGKEASLQLYFKGYEEEDKEEDDDDDDDKANGNNSKKKSNKKTKHDPKFIRVHGLSGVEHDKFTTFFQRGFSVEVEDEPWDVRGANFGELELSKLKRCVVLKDFENETLPAVEIPLSNVAQVAAPGKNEVEIQYTPSTSLSSKAFELSVIRFYIPSDSAAGGGPEENTNEEAEEWRLRFKTVSDLYDEQDEEALGLVCHIGEEICEFVSPKGRYDLDLYRDFFRMRGKTYDFKIPYSQLVNIHLLDHPEQDARFLMLTLNVAIRHGQQQLSHLVMVIEDEDTELELTQSAEELKQRYPDANLTPIMKGPMPESVAKLLKGVSNKKVLIMPATGFMAEGGGELGAKKERCVKCNVKTNQGFLYPMKTAMVFLHKPVLSIKYDRVEMIEFKRNASTMSNDTFDLEVVYQEDGDRSRKTVEFTLIPRKQFEVLRKFFIDQTTVKIRGKDQLSTFFSAPAADKLGRSAAAATGAPAGGASSKTTINDLGSDDSDEEEDSDFEGGGNKSGSGGSSSDDDGSSSDSGSDDSSLEDEVPMGTLEEELGDVSLEPEDEPVVGKRVRKPSGLDDLPKKKKVKLEPASGAAAKSDKKKEAAAEPEKKTASGGGAKKKDKNAPKAAKTAYTYFMESKKEEFAKLNFTERSQRASELWKTITDKSEFEALAAKDKQRYLEEMKNYTPPSDHEDEDEDNKVAKKKKDKNAPKSARTAYTLFSDEFRPTLKDEKLTFGEMNKKLGEMWKNQTDKTKWNDLAAQDKLRYAEEMKSYVPPPAEALPAEKKSTKKAPAAASASSKKTKIPNKKPALASALPSGSSSSEDDDSDEAPTALAD